jgi:hypothetical protein
MEGTNGNKYLKKNLIRNIETVSRISAQNRFPEFVQAFFLDIGLLEFPVIGQARFSERKF